MSLALMRWNPETFEQRFWKHVQKTPTCWRWTGFLDKNGRGNLRRGRADEGFEGAQRASWIVHNGQIPAGLFVLHTCDVPNCVNPDHLYLGTQQDNMRDVRVRGRSFFKGKGHLLRGSKNPHAKLDWDSVEEIRRCYASGESGVSLGKRFGVTKGAIYRVIKGLNWIK